MEGPTPPSEKLIEADPMADEFLEKSWDAMKTFNETSKGEYYWMPVENLSVTNTTQLSDGKYYWIDVVLAESQTRKSEMCPNDFVQLRYKNEINKNKPYVIYRLAIHSTSAGDEHFKPELIKVLQSTEREMYHCPTNGVPLDPEDELLMEKAWDSLKSFNQTSEGDFHWMPLKIQKARSFGNSPKGDLVKMEVVLGESQKRKGEISSEDFADERAGVFRVGGRRVLYRIPFYGYKIMGQETSYATPWKMREIPPEEED